MTVNWKNGSDVTSFWRDILVKFFWRYFVSLSPIGFNRNLQIGSTPVWVLLNIWRLGQDRNTKFGTNLSNKLLLNTAKCQSYSYNKEGKGGGVTLSPSTQIRVKEMTQTQVFVNEWFQTTSRSPWHQGNFWKFN